MRVRRTADVNRSPIAPPSSFIYEIFSGIQGEGPLLGVRQIFVRFCLCNLRCQYCDTRQARRPARRARLEVSPGSRQFVSATNPLSLEEVLSAIRRLAKPPGLHHSVSLTGGEPLLHVEFLRRLLPALHRLGFRSYLETNGTLPGALAKVLAHVDYVAADVKLASATGQRARTEAHREFLQRASKKQCIVKVVVAGRTTEAEMHGVGRLVASANPKSIVVLQPVTSRTGAICAPPPVQMLAFQEVVKKFVTDVRIIPQAHKFMGQL